MCDSLVNFEEGHKGGGFLELNSSSVFVYLEFDFPQVQGMIS